MPLYVWKVCDSTEARQVWCFVLMLALRRVCQAWAPCLNSRSLWLATTSPRQACSCTGSAPPFRHGIVGVGMKGHPGACQQTRGAAAWLHWLASALQLAHHHRTLCVALDEGCMSD